MSSFRALSAGDHGSKRAVLLASTPTVASHYWHTPEAGGTVDKGSSTTQVGRALQQLDIEHDRGLFARGQGALRAHAFGTLQKRLRPGTQAFAGITEMAEAANRFLRETPTCRDHNRPLRNPGRGLEGLRLRALRPPRRSSTTSSVAAAGAHRRQRQHRALRTARPPDPRYPSQTPLRQGQGPGP